LEQPTFGKREPARLKAEIEAIKAMDLRVLLTIRNKKEGGKLAITPKERIALFSALMATVDMVDIELSSGALAKEVVALARKNKKKSIVSFHSFKSTPTGLRLEKVVKEARTIGADIVKIAAFAAKKEDVRRLARLLLAHNDMIVIAMGQTGRSTRVTFPLLGSLITYAGISGATAPGQIPIKDLNRLLTELN